MELSIKSKQTFENHVDEFVECYKCNINFFENGFEICYDNCRIKMNNNILCIFKPQINLEIIIDKQTNTYFNTPYGKIEVFVKGISIKWNKEPFELNFKYLIKLENTAEYINELQMSILDK